MPGTRSGSQPRRPAAAQRKEAAEVIEAHKNDGNSIGEQEVPFHRPKWHRAYSFGLITGVFFLISWAGQFITQYFVVRDEAAEHGQPFEWAQFTTQFLASTFENWQSEFLQLFTFVVLTTYLVHRKSHESPDTDYDTEAALRRIEAKVDGLSRKRG